MTIPTDLKKHVEVTFADGSTRHLRYTLGARKRITDKFGSEPAEILKTRSEELLPCVLMEGIVEREGLTEETVMETLVDAPMVDYVTMQFIEAFFAPRAAQNMKRIWEATQRNAEQVIAALEENVKMTTVPATPAPAPPTVQ